MTESTEDRRTVRVPEELWAPFLALARVAEKTDGSAVVRRMIQDYLVEYGVFWAPEHRDIDPEEKPIAWYECQEHQDVHRLVPSTDPRVPAPPWGCSVTKSRQDRLEKEAQK